MRKFFIVTFLFLMSAFFSIYILFVNLDKSFLKNKIVSEFSSNFNHELNFNDEIDLSFFPTLSVKINNVNLTNHNLGAQLYIKTLFLNLKWLSILKKEIKINQIKLEKPRLELKLKKINISESFSSNKLIHKISENNFLIKQPFKFSYLKINDGIFEIKSKNQEYILEDISLEATNTSYFQINGNFKNKSFLSDFSFKSKFKEFKKLNFEIKHNFFNKKEITHIKGSSNYINGIINIKADLESEYFNLDNFLIMNSKKKKFVKENHNLIKVNNYFYDTHNIIIDVNTKLKRLIFNKFEFDNIAAKINFIKNNIYIKNLNGKYLDAKYSSNFMIDLFKKNVNGVFFIENFPFVKTLNKKLKSYIGNGRLNATFSFTKRLPLDHKIKNMKMEGKFFLKDTIILGVNVQETILMIDQIDNLNSFLNNLSGFKFKGSTKIETIEGDFILEDSNLRVKNVYSEDDKIKLNSEGNYNILSENFSLKNRIKIKTSKYRDLPDFGIDIFGDTSKYSINYDIDRVKEHFFEKTLKKILKKNNNKIIIDPDNILELFN